jgi:molecular chaperone GrpE
MDNENKNEKEEIVYEEQGSGFDNDLDDVEDKMNRLKEKLKKCQEEKQEYLTGWQREKADFINYKRRQEEQGNEWLKIGNAGLMKDLLAALDTMEAGIMNYELGIKNKDDNCLGRIQKQLMEILKGRGLEEIKAVGEKFNPEFHEAVESAESENGEEGEIIEEIQKGYLLNGKVLRTSKVKVNKNKQSE